MHDQWRGKWVLITGASAGIGAVFARDLAAGGANLVLTGRRTDRLEQLASQLRKSHAVQVETLAADLEKPSGPNEIFAFTQSRSLHIEFLINNAGFGTYGEFAHSDKDKQLGMVRVNCAAVVQLTHLYLPPMIEHRRGDIVILASTASFQGVPYMAVYSATKAFDLLFAEGLAQEVKRYGIRVCALCPGSTESEFATVAGAPTERVARKVETAEKVVRTGLDALLAGKHSVISGWTNVLSTQLERLVPRRTVTGIVEKMFRPPNI